MQVMAIDLAFALERAGRSSAANIAMDGIAPRNTQKAKPACRRRLAGRSRAHNPPSPGGRHTAGRISIDGSQRRGSAGQVSNGRRACATRHPLRTRPAPRNHVSQGLPPAQLPLTPARPLARAAGVPRTVCGPGASISSTRRPASPASNGSARTARSGSSCTTQLYGGLPPA